MTRFSHGAFQSAIKAESEAIAALKAYFCCGENDPIKFGQLRANHRAAADEVRKLNTTRARVGDSL